MFLCLPEIAHQNQVSAHDRPEQLSNLFGLGWEASEGWIVRHVVKIATQDVDGCMQMGGRLKCSTFKFEEFGPTIFADLRIDSKRIRVFTMSSGVFERADEILFSGSDLRDKRSINVATPTIIF